MRRSSLNFYDKLKVLKAYAKAAERMLPAIEILKNIIMSRDCSARLMTSQKPQNFGHWLNLFFTTSILKKFV